MPNAMMSECRIPLIRRTSSRNDLYRAQRLRESVAQDVTVHRPSSLPAAVTDGHCIGAINAG